MAALALLLMGAGQPPPGTTLAAAVAALLGGTVPVALQGALDAPLTASAAALVLDDLPAKPRGTGVILAARRGEFSFRAAYGAAAVARLADAVLSGKPLEDALKAEGRYLKQHREASRRRTAGWRVAEGMAELHGPVLGWSWAHTRVPEQERPLHKAADGKNLDLRRPTPRSVMALPGVLAGCTCALVAPHRNATTIY